MRIGIDLGGTKIAAVALDDGGVERARHRVDTPRGYAGTLAVLIDIVDPDVIVVGGGLSGLPGLYESVPARWGRYALTAAPRTRLLPR
ncbi:MAG TPA: hypothetical protein VGE72_21000 [Azospirillum sp.]